jgi:uncharacterized membrane protein
MNEEKLKEFFEKRNHEFQGELQKEFPVSNTKRIDYISKKGDIVVGIEVKGSRSNLYSTVGQLFFLKKIFSHLYVLAPLNFIKKLTQAIAGTPIFAETGFLIINKDGLTIIKKPDVNKYYFRPLTKTGEKKRSPRPQAAVNENDIEIIKKFQNRVFTAIDVSREFNFSRENAYRRIARLKKTGVIEELDTGSNPKAFRIVKHIDQPVLATT